MARTAAFRVSTDTASIYISVSPKRSRATAPLDPAAAIAWHVQQICKLAEEFVTGRVGEFEGHPQRIMAHERQLAKLGVCQTALYSHVNRARVYTRPGF